MKRTLEFCLRLKVNRITASNTIRTDMGIITVSVIEKYLILRRPRKVIFLSFTPKSPEGDFRRVLIFRFFTLQLKGRKSQKIKTSGFRSGLLFYNYKETASIIVKRVNATAYPEMLTRKYPGNTLSSSMQFRQHLNKKQDLTFSHVHSMHTSYTISL